MKYISFIIRFSRIIISKSGNVKGNKGKAIGLNIGNKLHDLLQRGNEEIKFPGAIRKTIDAIIDHFGAETRSR